MHVAGQRREHPRAFVITEPGAILSVEEVVAHAREWIAGYKVPRDLIVVPAMKRTPAGKADYKWAKDQVAAVLRAQVERATSVHPIALPTDALTPERKAPHD